MLKGIFALLLCGNNVLSCCECEYCRWGYNERMKACYILFEIFCVKATHTDIHSLALFYVEFFFRNENALTRLA